MTRKHLALIIGASGSGKTTLARSLNDQGGTYTVRSLMTRERRESDRDDECVFCSHAEFRRLIEAGMLLEHEEFNGNYYGTSATELARISRTAAHLAVKVIDPRGAASVIRKVQGDRTRSRNYALHLILVETDLPVLVNRLGDRGGCEDRIEGLRTEIVKCRNLYDEFSSYNLVSTTRINGNRDFPILNFGEIPKVWIT